eukprot:8092305-Alexandrium_andersonii.AAC.1
MSASLVGSEMCIRDRGERVVAAPVCSRVRADPHAAVKGAAVQPPSPGAVSYTHLTLPTICSV